MNEMKMPTEARTVACVISVGQPPASRQDLGQPPDLCPARRLPKQDLEELIRQIDEKRKEYGTALVFHSPDGEVLC